MVSHGRAEPPRQVASLNLCADQMLLALADREQIASVTTLSSDPDLSYLARAVGSLPRRDSAEAVLARPVDLVLVGPFGMSLAQALLRRQGVTTEVLGLWSGLDEGREQIRLLAARLGHPERGNALVADIDHALARVEGLVRGRPSILVYYRNGWIPTGDSLVGDILRHMGFALHQDALGLPQGGVPRLESVVTNPPDYALMDEVTGRAVDNGSALLVHPALLRAIPPERRLTLRGSLAICGGPSTPALIDALRDEVLRVVPPR